MGCGYFKSKFKYPYLSKRPYFYFAVLKVLIYVILIIFNRDKILALHFDSIQEIKTKPWQLAGIQNNDNK